MSFFRTISSVFVVAAMLTSCAGGKLALHERARIIFFGDSITQQGVRPGGYVSIIKDELTTIAPDFGIEVIGAGISGNKVPDLMDRMSRDVIEHKPTVVVIYIGINDVWHWEMKDRKGTTKEDFEAGLRETIARIQYSGAQVILCTPSVIGEKHDGTNPQDKMLEEYAQISRTIAKSLGAKLCDLRKAFHDYLVLNNKENASKGILTYDGVHLSDEGNKLVAQEVLKFLR